MKGGKVMILHVHNDERLRGEHAPLPLERRHTPAPAPWQRSKNLFQRIIGVLLLFVVGFATPASTALIGVGFFAVLGAAWLDSWGACLVVPVALVSGSVVRQLPDAGFELASTVLLTLSAFLGATLGTAFFKRKELWRRIQGKRL
jgi:hypothetical protein